MIDYMFKSMLFGLVGLIGITSMSVYMYNPEYNATTVLYDAVQNSNYVD